MEAKIATSEAHTETKIARMEGKLDLLAAKIDNVNENTLAMRREIKDSERAVKANGWIIFGAVAALIVGIAALQ